MKNIQLNKIYSINYLFSVQFYIILIILFYELRIMFEIISSYNQDDFSKMGLIIILGFSVFIAVQVYLVNYISTKLVVNDESFMITTLFSKKIFYWNEVIKIEELTSLYLVSAYYIYSKDKKACLPQQLRGSYQFLELLVNKTGLKIEKEVYFSKLPKN